MRPAARVTLLLAASVVVLLAACSSSASDPPSNSSPPPKSAASCGGASVSPGAAASLGLDGAEGASLAWSGRVGYPAVAEGDRLFVIGPQRCVLSLHGATGSQAWSWPVQGSSSSVMGLAASPRIVLVAFGDTHGHAPAMVYSATDQLVGLDPLTGEQRWSRHLVADGQGVPAVLVGGRVVVAEPKGTVIGLDAATGAKRWADLIPAGCIAADVQGGLSPAADVLPDAPAVTVVYQCADTQHLARLNPATGATQWTWTVPANWSVQYQSPVGSASGVLGVIVSGHGNPLAPLRTASTQTPPGYETDSLVAVDATTGKPLWQINDVVGSAGVYGGGGQLCLASGFGVTCYAAGTGAVSWREDPPAVPAGGGPAGPIFTAVVADAGRLYLTVATPKAKSIPRQSTTYHGSAGAFQLQVIDMASGHQASATSLPAFYGGSQQVVVSPDSPPGVLAVSDNDVFVSPQVHETNVIEAWPRRR